MFNIDNIIRRYYLNEGLVELNPNTLGYLQVINEILIKIKPSSLRDQRYIGVIQKHLSEVVRHIKKLNERIQILEEELTTLTETKNKKVK